MGRKITLYLIMLGVFGFLTWGILKIGQSQEVRDDAKNSIINEQGESFSNSLLIAIESFLQNFKHPLAILILQILTIIIVARIFGWLMIKIGQPTVIGEIIAGIALGPSLIGALSPEFSDFLFPTESLVNLHFLSQIGLMLFMFIIGMELDLAIIKRKAHDALVVSHVSIVFPYFLGVLLSYFLYSEFAPDNISFIAFALFIGITMSITAFPVLARIIQERDMTKNTLGSLVITCAAVDDVTAWSLLAVVIAIVKAGAITGALLTIAFSLGYVLFMFFIIKPLLNLVAERHFTRETVNKPILAIIFAILLLSSYSTEVIGIHALFGAFLAGVVIPANPSFRSVLSEKIEDLSLVFLLPLFFVFTGLRTQIGLLNDIHLWSVCFLIIAVAVVGKFAGSALAAKFVGQSWRDSLVIGALMNTRGLMELVVLNIGYDLGIMTTEIFTMLVLMALITTFMTGPAIDLIDFVAGKKKGKKSEPATEIGNHILISFGPPQTGSRLLQLAYQMMGKDSYQNKITALHLTPSSDISLKEAETFEKEGFGPILSQAKNFGIVIETKYRATNEVSNEIVNVANESAYDIMLVGSSKPLFSRDETGGKLRYFMDECNCSVGVLIDRGFSKIKNILLILNDQSDKFLLMHAGKFLFNSAEQLNIIDSRKVLQKNEPVFDITNDSSKKITIEGKINLSGSFVNQFDLMLLSLNGWQKLKEINSEWISYGPSVLIINK